MSAALSAAASPVSVPSSDMPLSARMAESMSRSSWIRRMSEEANRLKALHGAESVYDFSLGNPNTEPPDEFRAVIEDLLLDPSPGCHGYMPNAGYSETREAVAKGFSDGQGHPVTGANVVMTCGAAGGLNVVFRTILDPGDEVIVSRPYFGEYAFYVENHGGVLRTVPTAEDFGLDLDAIEGALSPKTRAVIVNSPNNPTGRVYSKASLASLGRILGTASRSAGRIVYLLSDEPYRRIVYDDADVPCVLDSYENALVVSSYSKELALAGERIGFVVASPAIGGADRLVEGLTMANRILGFVNAPALMQRAIARLQGVTVDLGLYRRNRTILLDALCGAGYSVTRPQGGFYLFPRSPVDDDVAFVHELARHHVITVPGTGFGAPGYFRMSYCVAPQVVDGALPALASLGAKYLRSR